MKTLSHPGKSVSFASAGLRSAPAVVQPPLPFPRFRVPARHVYWLTLANAGDYAVKHDAFYPFKTRFLHAHALADGYDLQIIVKKCWCGDGTWRGYEGTLSEHRWEPCWRCNGTRIYERKKIYLRRWLLGNELFHEPIGSHLSFTPEIRETIHGLIKHQKTVPDSHAERAFRRLLLRYEPLTLWSLTTDRMRAGARRLYWHWRALESRMHHDACSPLEDEVPF